jgi:hypothetical protein
MCQVLSFQKHFSVHAYNVGARFVLVFSELSLCNRRNSSCKARNARLSLRYALFANLCASYLYSCPNAHLSSIMCFAHTLMIQGAHFCQVKCQFLPISTPMSANAVSTSTPTTTSSSGFTKPYSYLPNGNYLTTVNDQMIDQNGNEVILHGIAWYGFGDPGTGMVEGLRQGSDSQTLDFATVVLRMKALGFNTIKLPFCFNTLLASSVPSYTQSCTVASTATLMGNLEESSKGRILHFLLQF